MTGARFLLFRAGPQSIWPAIVLVSILSFKFDKTRAQDQKDAVDAKAQLQIDERHAGLPIVAEDDFEHGTDAWEPTDAGAWSIVATDKGHAYDQHKKYSAYKPPFRSPFNIAWLKGVSVSDFVLDAQVLSTHEDYAHRDVCIFFGYQDPGHFYYVHLGRKTDDHANQIFIVNGADRQKISSQTTAGTPWDEKWHHVRIQRSVEDGRVEVFFDDLAKPVMTAVDRTFVSGAVGIGSFDDTSRWDDFKLRGVLLKSVASED